MIKPEQKFVELSQKIGSINKTTGQIGIELQALASENDKLIQRFMRAGKQGQDARPILARMKAVSVRRSALLNQTAECYKAQAALWQESVEIIDELNTEYTRLWFLCHPPS